MTIKINNGKITRKLAPRGYLLFKGPSLIDGKPIIVVAIIKSSNRKTGNMVQTYILRADMSPMEAIRSGSDYSICGNCPHRGNGKRKTKNGKGRSCYVNIGQGPRMVYDAYLRGNYPRVSPVNREFRSKIDGRKVRLGTYGDPAAMPTTFWQAVLVGASGWTGYTHQWRSRADLQSLVMASCDTEGDYLDATKAGWRTFRVRLESMPVLAKEVVCPASEEAGKRTSCANCQLCRGTSSSAKNIVIVAHGGPAVKANAKRTLGSLALV